jgi:hypothetical protein
MFIGYAIETLRAKTPLHAASTRAIEAVLAAGRRSRDSDCSKPHPFALNGDQVKGPQWGPDQSPVLWTGMLYVLKKRGRSDSFFKWE